jgi:hypothetical protein
MHDLPLLGAGTIDNQRTGGDERGFVSFPPFLFSIPVKQFDTQAGKTEVLSILKNSIDEKIDNGLVMRNDAGEEVLILDVTCLSVGPGPTYTLEEVLMIPLSVVMARNTERMTT